MPLRYKPIGAQIKALRRARQRGDTQEALAIEVGMSVRTLRKIENDNHLTAEPQLRLLATALGVPFSDIVYAQQGPRLVDVKGLDSRADRLNAGEESSNISSAPLTEEIPRFSEVLINRIESARELYELARTAYVVISQFMIEMDVEVSGYVQEVLAILKRVSDGERDLGDGFRHDRFDDRDFPELDRMKRLKEMLILLKGNDVLVYADTNDRRYPDGETPWLPGLSFETQLIIAFSPPGEDDDYVTVTVDNGRSIPAGLSLF